MKNENLTLGIPCKYSPIAIIPKNLYRFFEGDLIAKCRGNELARLELIKDYEGDLESLDKDCKEIFNMSLEGYEIIWRRRCLHETVNSGWVKVKMNRVYLNKDNEEVI